MASTAKSLATQYASAKRAANANVNSSSSSSSNANRKPTPAELSTPSLRPSARVRSTSMSNLSEPKQRAGSSRERASGGVAVQSGPMQRPASRSALDNIHQGMNARYAGVQSKVLLHNIRPHASNGNLAAGAPQPQPQPAKRPASRVAPAGAAASANERGQLANRLRLAQEAAERLESERDALRLELEREKRDKLDQVQQLKQELQDKLGEHERHNELQHQKLLEAYELADQNRRAADSVLAECRQRDDQAKRRLGELEGQLLELREFAAAKDEMSGKLSELREQLRQERERYEQQLNSLHQVFDREKIR